MSGDQKHCIHVLYCIHLVWRQFLKNFPLFQRLYCTLFAVNLGLNQVPGQGCCCCCPAKRARLSPASRGLRSLGGSLSTMLFTACSKIFPLLSTLKVEIPSKMPSASQGTLGTPCTVHRILHQTYIKCCSCKEGQACQIPCPQSMRFWLSKELYIQASLRCCKCE